jgi:pimeloyl-ACP methyl ester carboxylesterase
VPVAQLDEVAVFYEERGSSDKCVVFSHGFLMDHEMFAPQVDALVSRYRCISWDERAHGRTRAPGPFTYWDSARDVVGLLDHLSIETAALVGMSQGGFLTLRTALIAPERVRGLALIDSQAGSEDPAARQAYDALFDQWLEGGMSDFIADVVAAAIVDPADAGAWRAKWRDLAPDQVRHAYGALIERDDIHDRLGEIAAPATVLHGSADPSIPMEKAERLCEGLAGCAGVVSIEGAGHASNLSHPDEVNAALERFLGGLWSG